MIQLSRYTTTLNLKTTNLYMINYTTTKIKANEVSAKY